jgi:steroid delta-isomerase-like uncharacterized protein
MDDSCVSLPAGFTRRSVVTRLGIGAAGMLLAAPLSAVAQDASPSATDLPPAVAEWAAGWRALDPARIAATYGDTATIVDMPTGGTLEGREAIQAYLTQFFGAFDGFHAEILTLFATEEWAAAEWVFGGRYTGEFSGFPPGRGQSITVYGSQIMSLTDGQIQQTHRYYDVYGILVQLGLVPSPEDAATPAT